VFQHFVFVVMRLIDVMVPDIPNSLATTIKREQYLGKQALVDNHTALLVSCNKSSHNTVTSHIVVTSHISVTSRN